MFIRLATGHTGCTTQASYNLLLHLSTQKAAKNRASNNNSSNNNNNDDDDDNTIPSNLHVRVRHVEHSKLQLSVTISVTRKNRLMSIKLPKMILLEK